jgi:hypothetical protein
MNANEDALLLGELAGGDLSVLVPDLDDAVDQLRVEYCGHETRPDPLNGVGAGLASR